MVHERGEIGRGVSGVATGGLIEGILLDGGGLISLDPTLTEASLTVFFLGIGRSRGKGHRRIKGDT